MNQIQICDSVHLLCCPRQSHGSPRCLPVLQCTSIPSQTRRGGPKTRSPPHDAHSKYTSVMPPSTYRCGMVRRAKPAGKQSSGVDGPRAPQHDLTQLQGDFMDRGQVVSKASKEMSFKRRLAFSGRSSVNTMRGHLLAEKVSPALAHHLPRTSWQELQSQVSHKCTFSRSSLLLGKALKMCMLIQHPQRIFLDICCLPRDFSTQGIFSSCVENQ